MFTNIRLKKIYLILVYVKNIFLYKKVVFKDLKDAVFIHDRHSTNYFHWVCDVLPKICIKEKYIKTNKYHYVGYNYQSHLQSLVPLPVFPLYKCLGNLVPTNLSDSDLLS